MSRLNRKSATRLAFATLNKREKLRIQLIAVTQVVLNILDLAGVLTLGALSGLALSGINSGPVIPAVKFVLNVFNIETLSFQNQAISLALISTLLLIGRTILSVFYTRRTLYFLSRVGADKSSQTVAKFLNQPLTGIRKRSSQESLFLLTNGVEILVVQVLSAFVTLVSDISLLIILFVGLVFIDVGIAFGTTFIFGVVGWVLYRLLHVKAKEIGLRNAELIVSSNESILEAINLYRETYIRSQRSYYVNRISESRKSLAKTIAEVNFMPYISKYVIETTVIVGTIAIAAVQFYLNNAAVAVATTTVFLASGTRIAPAVLRIQQGLIIIKRSEGVSIRTTELLNEVSEFKNIAIGQAARDTEFHGFEPSVEIQSMSFKYPGSSENVLKDINLLINPGEFVAIVGPSGSGKTTFVDLILGILKQDTGKILISGMNQEEVINRWPGSISYVPQDIYVANSTIAANIAIGYDEAEYSTKRISDSLVMSSLDSFVDSQELGMKFNVGENGSNLSGGQRQRLGIARALYSNPKMIILDEATSALDSTTEAEISNEILKLKGQVTLVVVAHRLSTVINADRVVYLEDGEIKGIGTFQELRDQVPNFNENARIAGY